MFTSLLCNASMARRTPLVVTRKQVLMLGTGLMSVDRKSSESLTG